MVPSFGLLTAEDCLRMPGMLNSRDTDTDTWRPLSRETHTAHGREQTRHLETQIQLIGRRDTNTTWRLHSWNRLRYFVKATLWLVDWSIGWQGYVWWRPHKSRLACSGNTNSDQARVRAWILLRNSNSRHFYLELLTNTYISVRSLWDLVCKLLNICSSSTKRGKAGNSK